MGEERKADAPVPDNVTVSILLGIDQKPRQMGYFHGQKGHAAHKIRPQTIRNAKIAKIKEANP